MERDPNPLYLFYFYNSIILYFEKVIKTNPIGLRITEHFIKSFLLSNKIYPLCVDNKALIQTPDSIEISGESFITLKIRSGYSILYSVLYRIRNGLAHDHFSIYRYNNEDFVSIKDLSSGDKTNITMVAQMPLRVLIGLVESLKVVKEKKH